MSIYCRSKVGKLIRPGTGQDLSIGSGCDHWSTVAHELLHAFGFEHEQCRPDRDEYVTLHSENLQKGLISLFLTLSQFFG